MLMCRTSNILHKFSCSTIMIDLTITFSHRNANNLNSSFRCYFVFEKIKPLQFYLSKKELLLCSEKIKEPVTPAVKGFRFYSKEIWQIWANCSNSWQSEPLKWVKLRGLKFSFGCTLSQHVIEKCRAPLSQGLSWDKE